MGWADCGTDDRGRAIGYGVAAICDETDCDAEIDRGLSYACGSMHGGGEYGCGRYFCPTHLFHAVCVGDGIHQHYESLCDECHHQFDAEHPDED